MKTYFIDSDVLIDFFKKNKEVVQLIEHFSQVGIIAASVLTISELRSGWKEKEASLYLSKLYSILEVIPITKEIAELAGKYRQEFKTKGISLHTIDALIASTAIINDYCLVTHNKKDYPMPQVELY